MMAITPAIAANTAPTCGIVILTNAHLQAEEQTQTHCSSYTTLQTQGCAESMARPFNWSAHSQVIKQVLMFNETDL